MSTLRIRNWDRWQSYRKDRGQPPWIKIHREVMRNPEWVELSDAELGQLVAMWLLAADHNGVIPASPGTIQKLCYLDNEPNIQVFVDKGFIEPDANVTPSRRQDDAPETEGEAETEGDTEQGGAKAPYAFVGKVVKLNQSDFDLWKQSFPLVELLPYLVARDAFLVELPDDDNRRRKWMVSTASDLRNKNAKARTERAAKLTGSPKFKPEKPVNQAPIEERQKQATKH